MGVNITSAKLRKDSLIKTIKKVENEIASVFQLVAKMTDDSSAGAELIQGQLEKLAEKKKILEQELSLVVQVERDSKVFNGAKKYIETNVRAAKAAFKKAKPNLQKKLLGSVFKKLVATDLGLGIHYKLTDDMVMINHPSQIKKPSEVISDGLNMLVGRTIDFFVAQGSPIVGSGGPLDRLTQPIFHTVEVAEIIPYRRVKAYENVSFLTDLYLKRQWSLRRISNELGCCKATVRKKLIDAGIELPKYCRCF